MLFGGYCATYHGAPRSHRDYWGFKKNRIPPTHELLEGQIILIVSKGSSEDWSRIVWVLCKHRIKCQSVAWGACRSELYTIGDNKAQHAGNIHLQKPTFECLSCTLRLRQGSHWWQRKWNKKSKVEKVHEDVGGADVRIGQTCFGGALAEHDSWHVCWDILPTLMLFWFEFGIVGYSLTCLTCQSLASKYSSRPTRRSTLHKTETARISDVNQFNPSLQ